MWQFGALFLLFSPMAHAQEVPLHFQGVSMVYGRIYASFSTRSGCRDFYLSGAIVQVPAVSGADAEKMAVEPEGRTVYLTSGISSLSRSCPLLAKPRTLTISSHTFILYAVAGQVNATLRNPDGYWVETRAISL